MTNDKETTTNNQAVYVIKKPNEIFIMFCMFSENIFKNFVYSHVCNQLLIYMCFLNDSQNFVVKGVLLAYFIFFFNMSFFIYVAFVK